MNRWAGRVALVTGASVGIGAAISRKLVAEGMKVVGVARDVDKIKALSDELSSCPGSLTAIQCDITKDDQVVALFAEIKRQFGGVGVDVCINNAGLAHGSSLLEGTPSEWRDMLDTNVVGLCLCTKEAVASMKQRGMDDGHIIHISSFAAHRVTAVSLVHFYTATKFAVRVLTEGLRQELRDAKSHIRVSSINPGVVETEFSPRMVKDEVKGSETYRRIKCLQGEDIAATVAHFLAAPPHVQIHDVLIRPTEQST